MDKSLDPKVNCWRKTDIEKLKVALNDISALNDIFALNDTFAKVLWDGAVHDHGVEREERERHDDRLQHHPVEDWSRLHLLLHALVGNHHQTRLLSPNSEILVNTETAMQSKSLFLSFSPNQVLLRRFEGKSISFWVRWTALQSALYLLMSVPL